jgi:hypothetical protein
MAGPVVEHDGRAERGRLEGDRRVLVSIPGDGLARADAVGPGARRLTCSGARPGSSGTPVV